MVKNSLLKNKTLVIGCGSLGAKIALQECKRGKNVLVIDKDPNSFELLGDSFTGYTFVGDTSDTKILEEAYITTAKEVIIVTGDENANLFLAHLCRKIYNVPNIYVRFQDPNRELLLEGMNIKALYPLELTFDGFQELSGGKK